MGNHFYSQSHTGEKDVGSEKIIRGMCDYKLEKNVEVVNHVLLSEKQHMAQSTTDKKLTFKITIHSAFLVSR